MLVLDIGGTKVAAARWTDGVLHGRRQWPMPATLQGWRETLAAMAVAYPEPDRVAAAVTGVTDGQVLSAVNRQLISFWDGYALAEALAQAWHCPAVLLNDAQAAAWGEYHAGGRRASNLLFLTLSTGVGGGLVLDGRLRTGPRGLAGHIGHVSATCAPLDGTTYSLRDTFRPPLHPNCRCAVVPVISDDLAVNFNDPPRETFEEWARGRGIEGLWDFQPTQLRLL